MDPYKIVERIKTERQTLTEKEWFEIRDEIVKFLETDPPEEQKKLFVPLGCLDMVAMTCNGYKHKREKHLAK